MIRTLLLFSVILAIAGFAAWLAGNPGSVRIDFQGYQIGLSFAFLIGLVSLVCLVSGLIVWFIGFLRRELPIIGSNRQLKRQQKGFDYLNKSLVALSSGDHKLAGRLVGQAELLLPAQPMLHLIAAEAALKTGEHTEARKRFHALEQSDDGNLIGLRGLVGEARRTGRQDEALRLARKAFADHRKSPWVLKTLFSLEVAAGHWNDARTALEKVIAEKLIDPEQASRHRGALLFAEAVEHSLQGDLAAARKAYEASLKARAFFAPAVAALARLDIKEGKAKRADKRLKDTWATAPRPILARVYKELDVAESGDDWLKRVASLVARNPKHRESDLLLADAYLDAKRMAEAAPLIQRLAESNGDRLVWELKLRLASQLGENTDSIEDALRSATELPVWRCTDCNHTSRDWTPLCGNCGHFDTYVRGEESYRFVEPASLDAVALIPQDQLTPPV